MKRICLFCLLVLSMFTYSQKQYYYSNDSLLCVPQEPKVHNKLNIFSEYKVFGIVSGVTASAIPLFLLTNKNDKLGQYAFGSVSVISVATGAIALCSYLKSKDDKKPFIHYSCMFLAGTMDGFNEELTHHYSAVKYKMPYLNDQWFDPSKSWTNKYKNNNSNNGPAYPGSTGLLVGFTDAYHATRLTNKLLVVGGIITYTNKKTFKSNIKSIAISCASYTLGKGLIHAIF